MAAFASLSKRLLSSRHLQSPNPGLRSLLPALRSFTTPLSGSEAEAESESELEPQSDSEPKPEPAPAPSQSPKQAAFTRPLQNGLDPGVYRAIMVGKSGQKPVQKQLRSGRKVVLFSLATGGIRNNRRPLNDEEPREYAERCSVQWHRVCVYPGRLGDLALAHVKPGAILYLEGNLETKVFSDPISGLVRRIREIAIRQDGRLVFLSDAGGSEQSASDLKCVGYF